MSVTVLAMNKVNTSKLAPVLERSGIGNKSSASRIPVGGHPVHYGVKFYTDGLVQ
jgi:hypothetical protein